MLEHRGKLNLNCEWKARRQDAFENVACNVLIFMLDCVDNGEIQIVYTAFTL